ncbi:Gfo/Idh/MocA family protein [Caproiciproducens faecalis]|uniref:Gfo/Idh/MocA family oxidoreductase n=1 Tax=Caproiciproducens faecalis TaxID=2820301 RepID=A0ABS7DNU9_9FIRM|nr:Gfo/Idh/MocA family oxidoreductase [Caproiciproducens faecalis]MBW7572983.1 Gfo/Idh/MocA family oxidoreductase [Caproiciproducens faecalis]
MKLGIIGTSEISRLFVQGAVETGCYEPYAVYSRKAETGEEYASHYHIRHVFTKLEDLANCPELDVIYIASPNSLHFPQAKLCLSAGKHVIVEKPGMATSAQLEELFEIAEKNHVYLLEAIRPIYNPDLAVLKEAVAKIAPVHYVYLNYMKYSSKYDAYKAGKNPPVFSPEYDGGALADLGIYNLYLCVALFGAPKSSKCFASLLDSGVDGVSTQILEYDGFNAVLTSSKISVSRSPSEIQGENGTVTLEGPTSLDAIRLYTRDGGETLLSTQRRSSMYFQQKALARIITERDAAAYEQACDRMRCCIGLLEQGRRQAGIRFSAT